MNFVGIAFVLLPAILLAIDARFARLKRATSCSSSGVTIEDGTTQDVGNFRISCSNGYKTYLGCLVDGVLMGLNTLYRAANSVAEYKCFGNGTNFGLSGKNTHCQFSDSNTFYDVGTSADYATRRYLCTESGSQANFKTTHCIKSTQNGVVAVPVGSAMNVTLDDGLALMNCSQSSSGSTSLATQYYQSK